MKLACLTALIVGAASANGSTPTLSFTDSSSTCVIEKNGDSLELRDCGLAVKGIDLVAKVAALEVQVAQNTKDIQNLMAPKAAKSCKEAYDRGERGSGMYSLEGIGTRYCDMATAGGGWTLVARVNRDFDWVCPSKGGGNCNGASENPDRANLWHSSHWSSSIDLAPGSGVNSGLSTNPVEAIKLLGSGRYDVRFSFYSGQQDFTPVNDAYARFEAGQPRIFDNAAHRQLRRGSNFGWNVMKHGYGGSFRGETICWLSGSSNGLHRGYERGLFMGTGSCHLDNNMNEVQMKSHYRNGGGWYGGQHGFLNYNRLQVAANKIAVWVRTA